MVEGMFGAQNYMVAKRLLDAAALRQDGLAANIANVETPGYKRVDLDKDFQVELTRAVKDANFEALQSAKPQLTQDLTAGAVRADGNNVSMDRELMEVNRNALEYQFLTQYLSNNLMAIKNAISSQPGN